MILAEPPFYTLQGEGMCTGSPSVFIRFSGCNLRCRWGSNICDTPYASYSPERMSYTVDDIVELIVKAKCNDVVFTGGEPAMHYEQINSIIEVLPFTPVSTIETNGTIPVKVNVRLLSISPKLRSAGNDMDLREYANSVRELIGLNVNADYQIKFVVHNEQSVEEFKEFLAFIPEIEPARVYLMPQGIISTEVDTRLKLTAHACLENGWNLSDRLHLRIWGNTRGT